MYAINIDFNPRYWIYLTNLGYKAELLKDKDIIWQCVSCNRCTNICPKDVRPEGVMKALQHWLEADAIYPALRDEHGGGHEHWPELDRWLWAPAPERQRAASGRRAALAQRFAGRIEIADAANRRAVDGEYLDPLLTFRHGRKDRGFAFIP